jgi:DNA-binding CsgD family transcriptional regulator
MRSPNQDPFIIPFANAGRNYAVRLDDLQYDSSGLSVKQILLDGYPLIDINQQDLTARVMRSLAFGSLGATEVQTAKLTGQSNETVSSARTTLFEQLGARNMPHATAIAFAHRIYKLPHTVPGEELTDVQLIALGLAASGLDKHEAAAKLGVPSETAKTHRRVIRRKTGGGNIAHAVFWGFTSGQLGSEVINKDA